MRTSGHNRRFAPRLGPPATIATVADIADIAEVAKRYAQASGNDPQSVPGCVYIQLWKGVAEFTGRTVMRAGMWLDDPID